MQDAPPYGKLQPWSFDLYQSVFPAACDSDRWGQRVFAPEAAILTLQILALVGVLLLFAYVVGIAFD